MGGGDNIQPTVVILVPLPFHTNNRIILSNYKKNLAGSFDRNRIKLIYQLVRTDIFTM